MAESTGWVFKPDVPTAISVDTEDEFLSNTELYEAVLSSIQDGISVLKPDFKIIYVNKSMLHWYPGEDNVLGQKCYEVFHLSLIHIDVYKRQRYTLPLAFAILQ